MSTILTGPYLTFLQFGKSAFKDTLNIINKSNTLKIERLRKNHSSYLFSKFVKYETNKLYLSPIDIERPEIGGKIKCQTQEINFSQFSLRNYHQFGFYTPEKLVFGKFATNQDLSESEEILYEITENNLERDSKNLIFRHIYEIHNDSITYKFEVNPNFIDSLHEDVNTASSELVPNPRKTWTEKLFYNQA